MSKKLNSNKHKTIFGTTEKSNFILNLTKEGYSSLVSKVLALTCVLISLVIIPCEFNMDIGYSAAAGGLAVCGVMAMILSIIAVIKKYLTKDMRLPVAVFGFLIIWSAVSLINSFDYSVSFYGFAGRGEGLLATVFFFCIFIIALTMTGEKNIKRIFDSIVLSGLLNSIFAMIQLSGLIEKAPKSKSYYTMLGKTSLTAVSGLSQSPIFLAMLLCIAMSAALIGVCLDNRRRRRIFYIISAALCGFTTVFTYTVMGVIAVILACILTVIAVIVKKGSPLSLLSLLTVLITSAAAFILINTGIMGDKNYNLYDRDLMWRDSFMRLSASGTINPADFDNSGFVSAYKFMNGKTTDIIKKYPLVGTGPENLVYPQLHTDYDIDKNQGTFDKNYNEYLYIAATRGIPALLAMLALILYSIRKGAAKIKKSYGWLDIAALMLVSGGVLILTVSNSNLVFAPIFWIMAGLCANPSILSPMPVKSKYAKKVIQKKSPA